MVGNWKMHPASRAEAFELALAVRAATGGLNADIVICPPSVWLSDIAAAVAGSHVQLGAQTMRAEERGSYTGEI